MKQTHDNCKDVTAATDRDAVSGQNEVKETGADNAKAPRSWKQYIEQTMPTPPQETAAEQPRKAQSKGLTGEQARQQAKAAADRARAMAGQAGKNAKAAAMAAWERVNELTEGGREKVGQGAAKVRDVVARHPISPLLYATILAVGLGVMAFKSTYIRAYAMEVNGEPVAVVASEDEKDAIVSTIESRASDILGERYDYDADISMTPVYVTPDELSDTDQVTDALFGQVETYMTAYVISVDGVEMGRTDDKAELYQILDEVAQPYIPQDAISYEFVEDVKIEPIQVPANTKFEDLAPLREMLSALEIEEAVYVVKKGDTFNAIAYSLDMWPNELSILNPDIMVDKIWVGQELVIQEAVPFLSVQAVTDETYEEVIHSPVEYIETADLYVGDTRVKEQGEDGLALVNAHATYVNNVEVDREIITSTTLKEPTTTYTYTGTTPRPVTASNGYFIWPVRGTITSRFGGRNLWGRYDFHLGLDIAVPYGTGVKAADGGTVIKAGWEGSYGKLVAIRHDNGSVTYYAHNSSLLVSVGQKVYQGQLIARVGMTGNTSGPHCHFEVRINGTSVNPRNYLP